VPSVSLLLNAWTNLARFCCVRGPIVPHRRRDRAGRVGADDRIRVALVSANGALRTVRAKDVVAPTCPDARAIECTLRLRLTRTLAVATQTSTYECPRD
jgi:hypothetical protein